MDLSNLKDKLSVFLEEIGLNKAEIHRILQEYDDGHIDSCIDLGLGWNNSSIGYSKCLMAQYKWLRYLENYAQSVSEKYSFNSFKNNLHKRFERLTSTSDFKTRNFVTFHYKK